MEPADEPEPETVSTGEALTKWLDSHKDSGGTVKLADHVTLDGEYSFYPNGINSPEILVDTGEYTITVTGEISFLSNGRLAFSGEPDGKGIFYVAEKGVLSLYGISVESDQCALWQEEGAGLEISENSISGSIHYADTPFVMYFNDYICAVVEKGQTADDALPAQISCTVNRQGQLSSNEKVSVSWNLEGTEKQQEERRRFELQGSFLQAASAEPVMCAVAYNDYPLTFTDVQATISGGRYTFQGGFTAPAEALPFTVMSEYSFDGENWCLFEEQRATDTNAGFYIACKQNQRSVAADSNIYIRLQWNDNGTRYFSNVLCFAADNLENVEDIGGSRGGGTSIVNPPDEPQQNIGDAVVKDEEPDQSESGGSDSENPKSAASSKDSPLENKEESASQTIAGGESPNTENLKADTVQAVSAEPQDAQTKADAVQAAGAEPKDIRAKADAVQKVSAGFQVAEGKADATQKTDAVQKFNTAQPLNAESKSYNLILMAAGFVLLSAAAGTLGFWIHSRSGTNK